MKVRLLLIFALFLAFACSKKQVEVEAIYTEEEFTKITHSLTSVNAVKENAIPFHEYSSKVNQVNSKAFIFNKLLFFAIAFNSVEDARNEALRMNQYYSKNFMFDQVEGEPLLEDLVISTFKATNPKRKIQKVVKAPAHGEAHGSPHGEAHH